MSIEKQILKAVYDLLVQDEELLSMLGANLPTGQSRGTKSPVYSIIPTGQATTRMQAPFVVLEPVVTDRLNVRHSACDYTVTVYAEESDGSLKIFNIQERIRRLIDGQQLSVSGFVRNTFQNNDEVLNSQPLSLQFEVTTYRCQFVR